MEQCTLLSTTSDLLSNGRDEICSTEGETSNAGEDETHVNGSVSDVEHPRATNDAADETASKETEEQRSERQHETKDAVKSKKEKDGITKNNLKNAPKTAVKGEHKKKISATTKSRDVKGSPGVTATKGRPPIKSASSTDSGKVKSRKEDGVRATSSKSKSATSAADSKTSPKNVEAKSKTATKTTSTLKTKPLSQETTTKATTTKKVTTVKSSATTKTTATGSAAAQAKSAQSKKPVSAGITRQSNATKSTPEVQKKKPLSLASTPADKLKTSQKETTPKREQKPDKSKVSSTSSSSVVTNKSAAGAGIKKTKPATTAKSKTDAAKDTTDGGKEGPAKASKPTISPTKPSKPTSDVKKTTRPLTDKTAVKKPPAKKSPTTEESKKKTVSTKATTTTATKTAAKATTKPPVGTAKKTTKPKAADDSQSASKTGKSTKKRPDSSKPTTKGTKAVTPSSVKEKAAKKSTADIKPKSEEDETPKKTEEIVVETTQTVTQDIALIVPTVTYDEDDNDEQQLTKTEKETPTIVTETRSDVAVDEEITTEASTVVESVEVSRHETVVVERHEVTSSSDVTTTSSDEVVAMYESTITELGDTEPSTDEAGDLDRQEDDMTEEATDQRQVAHEDEATSLSHDAGESVSTIDEGVASIDGDDGQEQLIEKEHGYESNDSVLDDNKTHAEDHLEPTEEQQETSEQSLENDYFEQRDGEGQDQTSSPAGEMLQDMTRHDEQPVVNEHPPAAVSPAPSQESTVSSEGQVSYDITQPSGQDESTAADDQTCADSQPSEVLLESQYEAEEVSIVQATSTTDEIEQETEESGDDCTAETGSLDNVITAQDASTEEQQSKYDSDIAGDGEARVGDDTTAQLEFDEDASYLAHRILPTASAKSDGEQEAVDQVEVEELQSTQVESIQVETEVITVVSSTEEADEPLMLQQDAPAKEDEEIDADQQMEMSEKTVEITQIETEEIVSESTEEADETSMIQLDVAAEENKESEIDNQLELNDQVYESTEVETEEIVVESTEEASMFQQDVAAEEERGSSACDAPAAEEGETEQLLEEKQVTDDHEMKEQEIIAGVQLEGEETETDEEKEADLMDAEAADEEKNESVDANDNETTETQGEPISQLGGDEATEQEDEAAAEINYEMEINDDLGECATSPVQKEGTFQDEAEPIVETTADLEQQEVEAKEPENESTQNEEETTEFESEAIIVEAVDIEFAVKVEDVEYEQAQYSTEDDLQVMATEETQQSLDGDNERSDSHDARDDATTEADDSEDELEKTLTADEHVADMTQRDTAMESDEEEEQASDVTPSLLIDDEETQKHHVFDPDALGDDVKPVGVTLLSETRSMSLDVEYNEEEPATIETPSSASEDGIRYGETTENAQDRDGTDDGTDDEDDVTLRPDGGLLGEIQQGLACSLSLNCENQDLFGSDAQKEESLEYASSEDDASTDGDSQTDAQRPTSQCVNRVEMCEESSAVYSYEISRESGDDARPISPEPQFNEHDKLRSPCDNETSGIPEASSPFQYQALY